jgi:hypothetical protein
MKKELIIIILIFSLGHIVSADCDLRVSLLNQDPYPATPEDYVKVVFQVTGVENPECKEVRLKLIESYPFSLDDEKEIKIFGGTSVIEYKDVWMVPYTIRVDKNAIDGENEIEIRHTYDSGSDWSSYTSGRFNITIEDARTDFEVFIKDYNPLTNIITFEILNIGESDVEALTIEIPKQENIEIKGANRNVVGDLDSNEYTTAEFEADSGEGIKA